MSSNTNPKTILLKGTGIFESFPLASSVNATPGMLVELDSNGYVKPHDTAKGLCAPRFVYQNEVEGEGIDDAYTEDQERVNTVTVPAGSMVYAFLKNGENASIGTYLESDGAGGFQVYTNGVRLAQAREALNNATGAQARIKIEVL